jgi:ABC-2 type transport system permease protein
VTAVATAAGSKFGVIYRLVLRNQVTVGRLVAMAALGVVAVLLGLAVGVSSPSDRVDAGASIVDLYGLQLLAPVVALVFASSALGDLVDDSTLVYLWMRPVPRVTVAAAAALAALTVCLPAVTIPLVLSAALTGAGAALVGGTAVACLVGVTGYVGMFCALGLRFKRALVWGIAYILLWEGFVANASKTASRLSLRAYTRSIISEYTGVGLDQATLALAVAIVVPVAVAIAMVLYTGRRLARVDVD